MAQGHRTRRRDRGRRHTTWLNSNTSDIDRPPTWAVEHASATFTARVHQHALPEMDREAIAVIAALFLGDQAVNGVSKSV